MSDVSFLSAAVVAAMCPHIAGVQDAADGRAVDVDAERMSFVVRRAEDTSTSVAFGRR